MLVIVLYIVDRFSNRPVAPVRLRRFISQRNRSRTTGILNSDRTTVDGTVGSNQLVLVSRSHPNYFANIRLGDFPSNNSQRGPHLSLRRVLDRVAETNRAAINTIGSSDVNNTL